MKTIIVPCDFSAPSRAAFEFAVAMAERTGAKVIAVYVIYIPMMFDPTLSGALPLQYDPEFRAEVEKEAGVKFQEMKNVVRHSNVVTQFSVVIGEVVFSIINEVKNNQSDLVVMGTTGVSAMKEAWIGSTTEKIVRHCPVPVISIHDFMPVTSVKRILLPSILTLNQTAFINKVKEIQRFFGATLEILLVNTPAHFYTELEAKEKLEAFIEHYQLTNCGTHFKSFRTEEEGIRYMAQHTGAGLVALATHARKGLSHLFQVSVTEKVVNHLPCPVWTFEISS